MNMETAMYIKSHYRMRCRPAHCGKCPETCNCLVQAVDHREAKGGDTPQVLQLCESTQVTCPAGGNLYFLIPVEFG